jgi:hypothetical protein
LTDCVALFPARAKRVAALLPSSRLRPALLWPGVTLLGVDTIEYRRHGSGIPCNEVSIMVPVLEGSARTIPLLPLLVPEWFAHFGWYVLHLPVTTEAAREEGVEIWGYPKFLAEITFEEEGVRRRCRLRAAGQDILTLDVSKGQGKHRVMDPYTYTLKEGQLLRTRVRQEGTYTGSLFQGGASLQLGDHPLAAELRALGIGTRAVMCRFARQASSLVYPPSTCPPL